MLLVRCFADSFFGSKCHASTNVPINNQQAFFEGCCIEYTRIIQSKHLSQHILPKLEILAIDCASIALARKLEEHPCLHGMRPCSIWSMKGQNVSDLFAADATWLAASLLLRRHRVENNIGRCDRANHGQLCTTS